MPSAQELVAQYKRPCDAPPQERLTGERLWGKDGKPDPAVVKDFFIREGRLGIEDVSKILLETTSRLEKEPNLLRLSSPFVVVGDIHGQFYDLMKVFELGGPVQDNPYLFLGDYVDRGAFSTEVMLYLCVLKICYPTKLYILRGNHECRHITEYFNFRTECIHKYDLEVYDLFCEMFDCLPLAALVDKRYFCVHAGISPDMKSVDDIMKINRFRELPSSGLMADLCWSDPLEPNMDHPECKFVYNHARGCSYMYGYAACCEFLERNRLVSIIRAHEVQDPGYRLYKTRDATGFPTVFTVFSAPNYCDLYGNKGAILNLTKTKFDIKQFNSVPHPFSLPNSLNAISWSMPFLAESTTGMLVAMLKFGGADVDDADSDEEDKERQEKEIAKAERQKQLKAKLRAVTSMLTVFRTLREEAELVCELKGMVAGEKLPSGLLIGGAVALRQAKLDFDKASQIDKNTDYMCPPYSPQELAMQKQEEALPPNVAHHVRRTSSGRHLHSLSSSQSSLDASHLLSAAPIDTEDIQPVLDSGADSKNQPIVQKVPKKQTPPAKPSTPVPVPATVNHSTAPRAGSRTPSPSRPSSMSRRGSSPSTTTATKPSHSPTSVAKSSATSPASSAAKPPTAMASKSPTTVSPSGNHAPKSPTIAPAKPAADPPKIVDPSKISLEALGLPAKRPEMVKSNTMPLPPKQDSGSPAEAPRSQTTEEVTRKPTPQAAPTPLSGPKSWFSNFIPSLFRQNKS